MWVSMGSSQSGIYMVNARPARLQSETRRNRNRKESSSASPPWSMDKLLHPFPPGACFLWHGNYAHIPECWCLFLYTLSRSPP